MIYHRDLPKFTSTEEAFQYRQMLNAKKQYQLPYFTHSFRSSKMLIDNEVVDVLLSTWRLKNTNRHVDSGRYCYSIIETFENKYTVQITKWGGEFAKTHFEEGYTEIPNIKEIDKLVQTIEW